MSKNLLWPTTLLLALGVGYGLGAETGSCPALPSDLGSAPAQVLATRVALPQASSAPPTPREERRSGPPKTSERPRVAASASPKLEGTPASPPVAVAEAFPPAGEPDRMGILVDALLAVLPKTAKLGYEELSGPELLWFVIGDLCQALPEEQHQGLKAAAFRLRPHWRFLPDDPEVAFLLARETYQAAPDKLRLDFLAGALRKLVVSRKLTQSERDLLESLAFDHPEHEDLELAIVEADPEWARRHLARDGWTPSDARRLAEGKGPLAEQAAFEALAAGLDEDVIRDAFRLAPARTLELVGSMAHDPAWVRAGTMLRLSAATSAQDKLRIVEQGWETMTNRDVLMAVYGLRRVAGRRGRRTWSPTMTQAAKRVIRTDRAEGTRLLRYVPASLRVELLRAQTTPLSEWEEIRNFTEFLSEFPFVARAQLSHFLALFPGLSSRHGLKFAATLQRMGDPQGAQQVLDAMDPTDKDAAAARDLLRRGGWLFDLVD